MLDKLCELNNIMHFILLAPIPQNSSLEFGMHISLVFASKCKHRIPKCNQLPTHPKVTQAQV